jgi:hypothetical protein
LESSSWIALHDRVDDGSQEFTWRQIFFFWRLREDSEVYCCRSLVASILAGSAIERKLKLAETMNVRLQ